MSTELPRVSNRDHWLMFDRTESRIVGCQCGFQVDPEDSPYGDTVVDHIYRIGLAEGAAGRPPADLRAAMEAKG